MTVETPADPMCVCGDPKSGHRLGRKGCKAIDCGCATFEAADDAAEKTRVLEVVASVCEDQADRARVELGQESTSARLRAVEAERDEALGDAERARGYWHRCSADRDAIKATLTNRGRELSEANDRIGELEQLLADAALKLVQQQAQASCTATLPLRIDPPVELYGYDAWQCDVCGSRYRPFDPTHRCGPLKPVRISITERQEHHT